MKRLLISKCCLLPFILLCLAPDSFAFRKLSQGERLSPFVLVDKEGEELKSETLLRPITVMAFVNATDGLSGRLAGDLAKLSAEFGSDSLAIWIVAGCRIDKSLVLNLPASLRSQLLFDTAGVLNLSLDFVVLPSTGVFTSQGVLLAYFPLWRATMLQELRQGVRKSLARDSDKSMPALWEGEINRMDILNKCKELREAGRLDSAISILRRGLSNDTLWFEGALLSAELHLSVNNLSAAKQILETLLRRSGSAPEIYLGLAKVAVRSGLPDSALSLLATGKVLSARPEMFANIAGNIYYQRQELDSAIVMWREAIESLLERRYGELLYK